MKKEKPSFPRTVIAFLITIVFFFSLETNLSLISKPYVAPPSKSAGAVEWALKSGPSLSPIQPEKPTGPITCDYSNKNYDLCSINGPTLLDPAHSTIFAVDPTSSAPPDFSLVKIHPYPRKTDKTALSRVTELTLRVASSAPQNSPCGVTHISPALVFSTGGYTGNFFHEFNEVFLPLYITINTLLHHDDQDINLVITDWKSGWAQKYADILPHLTRLPIINLDNQTTTHCFPSAIVGLISHGPLVVDPTQMLLHPKTLFSFHSFIQRVYCKGDVRRSSETFKYSNNTNNDSLNGGPQLVLINRKGDVGRTIINLEEVVKEIKNVGFRVKVFEPNRATSKRETYRLIHTSHAMLAVHGAAMTHLLFQRPGAVLGEIVPIGTDWLAKTFYEKPARVLGLEYMRYKIRVEESSLADMYGAEDLVFRDPHAFSGGNWTKAKNMYLKTQNVKIDTVSFRVFIKKAFTKAKRFMDNDISMVC